MTAKVKATGQVLLVGMYIDANGVGRDPGAKLQADAEYRGSLLDGVLGEDRVVNYTHATWETFLGRDLEILQGDIRFHHVRI